MDLVPEPAGPRRAYRAQSATHREDSMKDIRRSLTVLATAVLLSLGGLALAAPAQAFSEGPESNAAVVPALGAGLIL
ncbi:hypothetical protein [Streptomyces sp. NPDC059008]|uniref:hypothetical protein n=1 Tax=unclassified Streptomyces TaxID=2593676 RepID=UPI0036989797